MSNSLPLPVRPDHGSVLTKEAINALPLGGFAGRIQVVDAATAAPACAALRGGAGLGSGLALGFDTESRPSFSRGERHPIALVQLATAELACLFRIDPRVGPPAALRDLLESNDVIKLAQGPADEIKEMYECWGVTTRQVVDLIPIARAAGCSPLSLRGLAAGYLGIRISKGAQTSNWAAPRLSERQQRYAATDAWACQEVYRAMGCPSVVAEPPPDVAAAATVPRPGPSRRRARSRAARPRRAPGV